MSAAGLLSVAPARVEVAGFALLLRLRWVALAAQAVTIAGTALWLPVPLHLPLLLGCLLFTLLSNVALALLRRWTEPTPAGCAALLLADTLLLTALLSGAGGIHNPFTSFYLLHVALAALLLPLRLTMAIIFVALGGVAWLYLEVPALCGVAIGPVPERLHLQGMFVALGLTAVSLAYFVGRMQDDLRRSERALAETQRRLERERRFASLATLAAGVAHELATPLSTVAIVSQDLEHTACTQCLNGACRDDARLIRTEVERCRAIIDRLNVDSTRDIGDAPEPVALAALPEELLAYLAPAHARRLKVTARPAPDAHLRVPRAALLQSLAVLIKNACEADPSGQPVTLALVVTKAEIVITVTDRGPGFAESVLVRLGEPFFTTKPPHEGKGLGLYLVRMFTERLGGRLEFHTPPGGRVSLTLPAQPEAIAHD